MVELTEFTSGPMPRVWQTLGPEQLDQVRQVVREEIAAAKRERGVMHPLEVDEREREALRIMREEHARMRAVLAALCLPGPDAADGAAALYACLQGRRAMACEALKGVR